ncbi:MAG: catalase [Methylovirgula sp.]
MALPHGMAIKYHLKDGGETDMVLNSLKFFPVADGAGFRDLLLAIAASPPSAPKPTKLDLFFKSHPAAPAALGSAAPIDSFADEQYNGVDAFVFVDKSGKKQPIRYIMAPEKLVHIDPAEAAKKKPDYLIDELTARLGKGPVIFHLKAQLAAPGDSTKDPTQPWPADRKVVDLAVLTIDKVDPDSLAAQKKLLFLPGALLPGIEESDDPLIDVRDGAYVVSFGRRSQ